MFAWRQYASFGVGRGAPASCCHLSGGTGDEGTSRALTQQTAIADVMRRRAEAATKTLLKEAKREEQQIAGVMEARASTGVRLVEGPVRRR